MKMYSLYTEMNIEKNQSLFIYIYIWYLSILEPEHGKIVICFRSETIMLDKIKKNI